MLIPFSYNELILNGSNNNKIRVCDVFDCRTEEIRTENIKSIGTEEGYYSDEVEKFFSRYIENDFAAIRDKFKTVGDSVDFTDKDIAIIKMFFLFSILRCPTYKNIIEQTLKKDCKIAIQEAILFGMEPIYHALNDRFNLENRSLKLAHITIVNREFVLPQNVFYFCSNELFGQAIVFPVQRKWAIILVDGKYAQNVPDTLQLKTDEDVNVFNGHAYLTERETDDSFLVGYKNELAVFASKDYEYKKIYACLKEGKI